MSFSGHEDPSDVAAGLASRPEARVTLSVVIPCWNDLAALTSALATISRLVGIDEVIVADVSETDQCGSLALAACAQIVRCSQPNRGAQMNAGARLARSDVLLFQHADTELSQTHIEALSLTMQNPVLVGGAFHRKFDARHGWLQWLERFTRTLNERGGTLYGDQSIFVRRTVFEQLGGFAEIPLMEDLEFSRRLQRVGRTAILDPPIASSPRHHQRRGALRTSIRNAALIALYRLGVPPAKLHAWYYRRPIYD